MASKELKQIHQRLATDKEYFSANVLKVKNKAGRIVPFKYNQAQKFIHQKIETQKKTRGYVRALLMKGRQQGVSTYFTGRHYHSAMYEPGSSVYILAHKQEATKELYKKIQLFKRNSPEGLKPKLLADNMDGMQFENESTYTLGTAGGKAVGRSLTVQKFHGSEVAFYEDEDDIVTGVVQTIGLAVPGTEIVFESTANGPSGMFYNYAIDIIEERDDEFELIFIPWYWDADYAVPVPKGQKFELTPDEMQLRELYDLSDAQLNWRRKKMMELKHEWKFKQEYPNNPIEAFQHSTESLVHSQFIELARKCDVEDESAPCIIGYDPKGTGGDTACIVIRQGRKVKFYKEYDELAPTKAAFVLSTMVEKYKVDKIFLDMGYGYGTYDILQQGGFKGIVVPIHFNEKPVDQDRFMNKRAEMYYTMKEWLEEPPVNIPDDDRMHSEILCIPEEKTTSNGKIYIVPKDTIKKNLGRSPGIADALALTFAYPVRRKKIINVGSNRKPVMQKNTLTTLKRHSKIRKSNKTVNIFDL